MDEDEEEDDDGSDDPVWAAAPIEIRERTKATSSERTIQELR
jgi:hypothetical protein